MLDRLFRRKRYEVHDAELRRRIVEGHWAYPYGLDISEVGALDRQQIQDHNFHMEAAGKDGRFRPISYEQLLGQEEFKERKESVVLFDTATRILPGNHWRVVESDVERVSLQFCTTYGHKGFEPANIRVPRDEPFFTGFCDPNFQDSVSGEPLTLEEVQRRYPENLETVSSKEEQLYFSTPDGIEKA